LDLVEVELFSRTSALVFGALTIPTLEHLRIISCSFPHNVLPEFLSRHNTITTFDLTSRDVYQLPRAILPALVSLTCNANTIGNLLKSTAFPKLAHVCVAIHYLFPSQLFKFDDVEALLARAAKRLTETNIRLCLNVLPASRGGNFVNLKTLPNDLRNHPVLSHVREIAFDLPRLDVVPTTTIPAWLSMFPLLEHIEFLNTPMGLDSDYESKMSFLRRVAQECAGIRTVKIGDDTRDISDWLSSYS
jgi:hypothetical protein